MACVCRGGMDLGRCRAARPGLGVWPRGGHAELVGWRGGLARRLQLRSGGGGARLHESKLLPLRPARAERCVRARMHCTGAPWGLRAHYTGQVVTPRRRLLPTSPRSRVQSSCTLCGGSSTSCWSTASPQRCAGQQQEQGWLPARQRQHAPWTCDGVGSPPGVPTCPRRPPATSASYHPPGGGAAPECTAPPPL